jgi:cellulose synthase/poly-beta-1,6-N-acetylglucosamine synthase-like glycosyltransferase
MSAVTDATEVVIASVAMLPVVNESAMASYVCHEQLPSARAVWCVYNGCIIVMLGLQAMAISAILKHFFLVMRRVIANGHRQEASIEDPVAVVVPCYLPNEARIIEQTLLHILNETTHVANLDVYIVYNTPYDVPDFEQILHGLASRTMDPLSVWSKSGRRLFVHRLNESKSKADNLNYVIKRIQQQVPVAKYTAIYDADHHPDPESLSIAIRHLEDSNVDCVQGSTYIREGFFIFKLLINADFFFSYFVMLPTLEVIAGMGFFGGANGVWRQSSLRQLEFDAGALTEDIDCFCRAVIYNKFRFAFFPESRSGELAPATLSALWKQRSRWAMGWDEVTMRHSSAFWYAPVNLRQKIGLFYIFICRYFGQTSAVMVCLLNCWSGIKRFMFWAAVKLHFLQVAPPHVVPTCTSRLENLSFVLYLFISLFAFFYILIFEKRWEKVSSTLGFALYISILPLTVIVNGLVGIFAFLFVVILGQKSDWVVTQRAHAQAEQKHLLSQCCGTRDVALIPYETELGGGKMTVQDEDIRELDFQGRLRDEVIVINEFDQLTTCAGEDTWGWDARDVVHSEMNYETKKENEERVEEKQEDMTKETTKLKSGQQEFGESVDQKVRMDQRVASEGVNGRPQVRPEAKQMWRKPGWMPKFRLPFQTNERVRQLSSDAGSNSDVA